MTITELISALQQIRAERGDMEVYVLNPEFQTQVKITEADIVISTYDNYKCLIIEQ